MISYTDALNKYNKAQAPKHSRRWLNMPDHARYLRGVGMTHYGIHQRDNGEVYYRCYDTELVKFYPPNEQGEYKVEVKFVNTPTTTMFLDNHRLNYGYLETSCGKTVYVPYVQSGGYRTAAVTASLVFNASNKLILDKSWHEDIYTKISSTEDKRKRKHLREAIKHLVMLNEFRLPQYKSDATLDGNLGMPFGTGYKEPFSFQELRRVISSESNGMLDVGSFNFNSDRFIHAVMLAGQDVFNILASQRGYALNAFRYFYRHGKSAEELAEHDNMIRLLHNQVIESVSPEDFNKSFTNKLLSVFNIKQGTTLKAWGQFRDKLPHKWYTK